MHDAGLVATGRARSRCVANTSSIWLFSPRTSASNSVMPLRARDAQQVLEQQRADAPALVLVGHGERDLGGRAAVVRRAM